MGGSRKWTKIPLFGNSWCREETSLAAEEEILAAGTALPNLSARCHSPLCSRLPAQPLPRRGDGDLPSITALSHSRASAGEKHSTLVNQSCLDLCTPATLPTSSLGFSSSFHLWHIRGARPLLQLEPGGQTATGASRGAGGRERVWLSGARLRNLIAFFIHVGETEAKGAGEAPSRPPRPVGQLGRWSVLAHSG